MPTTRALERDNQSFNIETGYDILKRSWVGQAGKVSEEILQRLGNNRAFIQYVGLSVLARSPDAIKTNDQTMMWDHVASSYAATDAMLNRNIWENYQRGHQYIHPAITLRERENFLTAELKLRTLLQILLLNHRGAGYTIESLAQKFMRVGELTGEDAGIRFRSDVPNEYIRVYIRRTNGAIFQPDILYQNKAIDWDFREWIQALYESRYLSDSDETILFDQFKNSTLIFHDEKDRLYIRTRKGEVYMPPPQLQPAARNWGYHDWLNHLKEYIRETHLTDVVFIEDEMKTGRQPFVQVNFDIDEYTPWTAIPFFGVWLQRLTNDDILILADGRYCDPSCQEYHGKSKELKELSELIAPVDARLFAQELLESYKLWREKCQTARSLQSSYSGSGR